MGGGEANTKTIAVRVYGRTGGEPSWTTLKLGKGMDQG